MKHKVTLQIGKQLFILTDVERWALRGACSSAQQKYLIRSDISRHGSRTKHNQEQAQFLSNVAKALVFVDTE